MGLDFELSDEQRLIKQTAKEMLAPFLARREEYERLILKEQKFPQELWNAMAESGFLGCLIPEQYGGTDTGLLALAFAIEELARCGFGNALTVVTAMDTACIVRNGTAELKQRFLPGIADGKIKLCFALTEPNAGTNTFRIETLARRDGDDYLITGQKTFITGADVADYMLLVTRTMTRDELAAKGMPKAFGLTLFLVDPKTPGIELQPLPTRGIEGFKQLAIYMESARVPATNLVGQEHAGAMALFNSLNPERILAAAMACGIAEQMLDRACSYARERKVFSGQPIGKHQAIQHPLAEIRIRLEAGRLLAYQAAWAFDAGKHPGVVGTYSNMAKHFCSSLALDAVDRAIQTFGGYGFSEDYGIIYYWDAVRLLKTAPITNEMILNYIGEHVLELPKSY
ncbi:MAG: acyl-CoA/acyl-ACP dehydrogenase [Candidatus Schekmanbacteria bacterium]|nr:acyl-CoA/acyl-ACP dehydrogenase [Candidatus Schekmanbacteria bacterium]